MRKNSESGGLAVDSFGPRVSLLNRPLGANRRSLVLPSCFFGRLNDQAGYRAVSADGTCVVFTSRLLIV